MTSPCPDMNRQVPLGAVLTETLDGDGHTLTIDTTYKGLVNINSGTIRNLTICGADLNSVSAICRINYGLLEGCSNTANFSNEKSNNSTQDGAICSINEKSGIIRGCYNTGKLTGQYVGGICGQNYGLVENCLNTGMILSEGHAGGIGVTTIMSEQPVY